MSNRKEHSGKSRNLIKGTALVTAAGCAITLALVSIHPEHVLTSGAGSTPALTPWASVGGCGAGGSGGGGGGAKWVGKGVTGGLLDVQVLYGYSFGQNFANNSMSTRLSTKPRYDTQIGLSIPLTQKSGEAQPKTTGPSQVYQTGGMGDLGLDVSQALGMGGEFSIGLSVTIPTAQYDIKRPWNKISAILPTGLQKGSGLMGTSLSLGWVKDVEDGMWLIDASYSHPMAVNFSGENQFLDTYYSAYKDSTDNKRFYYYFKPYGENDLGDYMPPSVTASVYYGNKKFEGYTLSWGATFSVPVGVAWIHEENYYATATGGYADYKPRPDPDNKAWSATLNFGLETAHPKLPFFFAVSVPIHDQSATTAGYADALDAYNTEPLTRWDAPDWKDFLQQWTFSLGVKATLF